MIEIQLPEDGVEADVKVLDKNGKPIKNVDRILIRPYFHNPKVSPNVLYLRVLGVATMEGDLSVEGLDELSRIALQLSGISGKFKALDLDQASELVLPEFIAKHLVGPPDEVEEETEYEEEEENDGEEDEEETDQ